MGKDAGGKPAKGVTAGGLARRFFMFCLLKNRLISKQKKCNHQAIFLLQNAGEWTIIILALRAIECQYSYKL